MAWQGFFHGGGWRGAINTLNLIIVLTAPQDLMTRNAALFLIIFLEGYVMLSTEMLAIRLLIPFTGNGTDTVSIIVAAVLLPLALGYHAGGRFRPGGGRTVRGQLLRNLTGAAAVLTAGLSYVFLSGFFDTLEFYAGAQNRRVLAALYAVIFLAGPVFMLGQTVPLVSHYFRRGGRLPEITGRILFFSTVGSFMGAVFCTLVLMAWLGVHNAAIVTIGCMAALIFLLAKKKAGKETMTAAMCFIMALALNSEAMMTRYNISRNNVYNTVQIEEMADARVMRINNTFASGIYKHSREPLKGYFEYVDDNFIAALNDAGGPRSVLVIGAGGFVIGRNDAENSYTYVDIDKDLKDLSERDFLEEKLGANKEFVAMEARAFLRGSKEKFDLIVLDIYQGPSLSPEHLVTREFFQQVKDHLKEGGAMVGNYVASATFADAFSVRLDNTLRSVFPNLTRELYSPQNPWTAHSDSTNIAYSYINRPVDDTVYTDDINTSFADKPLKLPR
jgi:predicted membrane-bound spermidine synthase